jgi:4-amino-4-deoxy-L-arabinose transferase-like glycosyltransferase
LGFLQKGLAALAVPGLALVTYTLLRRDAALWARLHLGAGLAVLAVWVLPWNVLLALRDGRYAEFFLIHEHFTRFLTNEHQRVQPFWYFGAVLVGACLPWTALMLQSAWAALRSRTRIGTPGSPHFDVPLALAVWAATVVVFFSLSGSKLVPYIMPCVPPLALLAGRALALREVGPAAATGLRPLWAMTLLLALILLAAPPVALALVNNPSMLPVYREMEPFVTAAGLIVLCAALSVALMLRARAAVGRVLLVVSLAVHMACLVLVTGGNALAAARAPRSRAGGRGREPQLHVLSRAVPHSAPRAHLRARPEHLR